MPILRILLIALTTITLHHTTNCMQTQQHPTKRKRTKHFQRPKRNRIHRNQHHAQATQKKRRPIGPIEMVTEAVRNNDIDTLRIWAPHVDLNAITIGPHKHTLLHLAASRSALNVMNSLISRGVPINSKNNKGRTPFFYAAKHKAILAMRDLLGKGANPRIADNSGKRPALFAVNDAWMINILRNHAAGQSINEEGQPGLCPVCFECKEKTEHRLTSLFCLHTLCGSCKQEMIERNDFSCPLCRTEMDNL